MATVLKSRLRYLAGVAVFVLLAGALQPAYAAFHLWYIQEAYSNQSGSVQFIELFSNFNDQQYLNSFGATLTSNSHTFSFPTDSPAPTGNHYLLLATDGFGSIPGGATPDYTIPSNFFDPAADDLVYAGGYDDKSFTNAPSDGVNSLNFSGSFATGTTATNSPRNYAEQGSSVNLGAPSPTGDYNGNHVVDAADYALWRKTLTGPASPFGSGADGNANGTIDAGDYTFWRARFGNPAPGSGSLVGELVPEPITVALQFGCLLPLTWRIRKRTTALRMRRIK